MKSGDTKLQRWIDLTAALVIHRYGLTLDELKSVIPAYAGGQSQSTLERMFERDKDELRALGIPIRVRTQDAGDGETQHYYIKPGEMYLPYLALAAPTPTGRRVPPAGYRAVPTLVFEPDELSALINAAHKAESVGADALSRDAASAIQKLT